MLQGKEYSLCAKNLVVSYETFSKLHIGEDLILVHGQTLHPRNGLSGFKHCNEKSTCTNRSQSAQTLVWISVERILF